jgi:hypothetical protein
MGVAAKPRGDSNSLLEELAAVILALIEEWSHATWRRHGELKVAAVRFADFSHVLTCACGANR